MFNSETVVVAVREYFKQWTMKKTIAAFFVVVVLAAAIVVALDPAKQLVKYRNSQRRSDIIAIINALYQYSLDHDGKLPVELSEKQIEICKTKGSVCDNFIDMSVLLGKYLPKIPVDPLRENSSGTGYSIMKSESGRITVSAPSAENATISVTR